MDSELYFLKTNFYEDEKMEQTLCEKFVEKEWTVFSTFRECVQKLQENKNELGISYPLLDKHFFSFNQRRKLFLLGAHFSFFDGLCRVSFTITH